MDYNAEINNNDPGVKGKDLQQRLVLYYETRIG
jgi:hypothetical protein